MSISDNVNTSMNRMVSVDWYAVRHYDDEGFPHYVYIRA